MGRLRTLNQRRVRAGGGEVRQNVRCMCAGGRLRAKTRAACVPWLSKDPPRVRSGGKTAHTGLLFWQSGRTRCGGFGILFLSGGCSPR